MYILKCQQCSNEYKHERKTSKFCTRECYIKSRIGIPKPGILKGKCKNCNEVISSRRVYCKKCYEEYNTAKCKRYKMTPNAICADCGIEKTLDNAYSPEPGIWATKCRKCTRKVQRKSEQSIKQKCVNYKGGTCQICGYSKCNAALDFHHTNPDEKDFSIARKKYSIINEEMKRELDKCVLICSNCHREEHSRLSNGFPSLFNIETDFDDWNGASTG